MKGKRVDIFWGLMLVFMGGLFLTRNLGIVPDLSPILWSFLFMAASIGFFASYFIKGKEQWWWLFPALGSASIAIIIWLAEAGIDGAFMGTMVLWSAAIPFFMAYFQDRKANWWALIPGWVTAVIGGIILLENTLSDELIGAMIMVGIALPFLFVYLSNRKHWWALIPTYVMGVLAVIILLSNSVSGELVGALFMFATALPFFVIYLLRHEQRWALIPTYVLGVLGLVVLFSSGVHGEFVGAMFMFALALPFFILYLSGKLYWWALIPAGILSSIGLIALLSGFMSTEGWQGRLLGVLLFLGMSATFGVLWLQRQRTPTEWAKYPAVGLAIAALLVMVLGEHTEILSAIVLIAIGAWLIIENGRRPKLKG
ncbi:MAG: hypothetical protein KC443_19150 [Anaerolineales bacterium]|nr:hypothetical protein [Anaerolineales bacterium]